MPHQYIKAAPVIAGLIMMCLSTTIIASPSLNSFIQQIWENNPSIKSAQSALEAAKAKKTAASQPIYNPEVDFDVERTDVNAISVGINQSFDWGNKQSAATDIASANIQLAEADLNFQRLALAEEFLVALVNLHSTIKMQRLAQQRVNLMEEFVSNTDKRQQAGDIGLQDVALAKVALSQARMQLARTVAKQAENEAGMQAASGMFTTDWPILMDEPPKAPVTLKIERYFDRLPKLIAMKAQLAAAKSNINLSKAATRADPSFGLRGGVDGDNALVGLSFSIPLNIRNNFRAEVEVAHQEALQIELQLLSEIHRTKAHINGAHRGYLLTYNAWQSWKETGLSSLKSQMELIRTIWKSGEMSTSDYLIQSKQNVDARETAVELSAQMWSSWLEWLAATGQIKNWLNESNAS